MDTIASHEDIDVMTWRMALIIGFIQCIAMMPGTSRSLVTIVGGVIVGLHIGVLRGHDVAVAVGGVGTTNAAAATAALSATVSPDAVVCLGVAGGLAPALVGDVVIGSGLISYGYGHLDADGFTPKPTEPPRPGGRTNPLVFPTDPELFAAARRAADDVTLAPLQCTGDGRGPGVHTGVIATEDAYSVDSRRNAAMLADHGCLAFEMEGAAIAQICHQNDVRFLEQL